ncbi:MAG: potassium/proton antiporter [Hyphomicrobiales bacterium]|nr:potassium/proton antiporter [Hyphomicrobiales bacterium]
MEALDSVSIIILLGALLVLAGIMSSLVAMRFGAPLLLVFLVVGMLAGEAGPGGIKFDDIRNTYLVGSIALALILFDGGLRTRFATFRNVLAPAVTLATLGVLLTAALTAPVARYMLGMSWPEALLVGAVVASTDAAAVFFLIHARGLRLRPRVGATIEVESGSNDPFAVLLTIILVEFLLVGDRSWQHIATLLAEQALLGALIGILGGRLMVLVLNRLGLAQGLHAPFVTTGALVIFGFASSFHASGFLAVYLAGLVVGNLPTRAHNTIIVFLDAVTWLAQIVMFVLLGLLVWPDRLMETLVPALAVAAVLMLVARPVAVFLCLWPFSFSWWERAFVSWVGLRGAVGIFLASIPLLVGLPRAYAYFDIAFVVVLTSLLIQGWTIAAAARRLHVALPRHDPLPRRVELDLPGQLAQEIVGYPVSPNSPYVRRGLLPSWARPTLVVRDEQILGPAEAQPLQKGDYIYLLAPPEKAQALDRFFVEMPALAKPDPRLFSDFFIGGDATLGALAEMYGLRVAPESAEHTLADHIAEEMHRRPREGDIVPVGPISLLVHRVVDGRVTSVGLHLPDDDEAPPTHWRAQLWRRLHRLWMH